MYISELNLRVRYGETDRMGYVYYGNYAEYFEVARVEAMRNLGISYKELEDNGILLPVYTYNITFLKPAFYDDVLLVKTKILRIPQAKIEFEYETYNSCHELINTANTVLVFLSKENNKPIKAPDFFVDRLKTHF
ncbi:MAG TPA: acyl-CoA thioesterase [Flavobacteriales bacterium]|nr:acyl-CoA thioesterase [Flavobacteriales bacterium]HIN39963.1 acyl-CoA thioesterase [Flavobacteriales bacterium]